MRRCQTGGCHRFNGPLLNSADAKAKPGATCVVNTVRSFDLSMQARVIFDGEA